MRRLCLSLFTICQFFENDAFSSIILIFVLCLYLLLQVYYQPFIKKLINQFEIILILFTIIILYIERAFNDYYNISNLQRTTIQTLVSLLTFIPLIIFFGLIYYFWKTLIKHNNDIRENNPNSHADVELQGDDNKTSALLSDNGNKTNYQSL